MDGKGLGGYNPSSRPSVVRPNPEGFLKTVRSMGVLFR